MEKVILVYRNHRYPFYPFSKDTSKRLRMEGNPKNDYAVIYIGAISVAEGAYRVIDKIYYFVIRFLQVNVSDVPKEITVPECLINELNLTPFKTSTNENLMLL